MTQFRVPVLESFSWQEPINGVFSDPAVLTPIKGDRIVVGAVGVGVFASKENTIAWYDGVAWHFDTPSAGWQTYNKTSGSFYKFTGTEWDNKNSLGELSLAGDITTTNAIDWDLKDNVADSLSFDTGGATGLLRFNTLDGNEAVELDHGFVSNGLFKLNGGSIDLESINTTIDIKSNSNSALSFDSAEKAGIIKIDSTTGSELVSIGGDFTVEGDFIVSGTTTTINSTELTVEDKLVTLNKGGNSITSANAGIEIEEDAAIAAFFKVASDRTGWDIKSPDSTSIVTIKTLDDAILSMSGDLTVEAPSFIDQDLTTDATSVEFAGLKLTGNLDLSANPNAVSIKDNSATALSIGNMILFDTTTDNKLITISEKVKLLKLLELSGNLSFTTGGGITSTTENLSLTDGTKTVTVAEAALAYSSRAVYDGGLRSIIFTDIETIVNP